DRPRWARLRARAAPPPRRPDREGRDRCRRLSDLRGTAWTPSKTRAWTPLSTSSATVTPRRPGADGLRASAAATRCEATSHDLRLPRRPVRPRPRALGHPHDRDRTASL